MPIASKMKCLFLNTYYPKFLSTFYQENIHIISKSYEEQKALLQAQFFGDSDLYSHGLRKAGWEADEIIVNDTNLQQAWARENDFASYTAIRDIAVEQIRRYQPHVLYFQDLSLATVEFINAIRPYTSLIVGQIASPLPQNVNLHRFDLLVSAVPTYVEYFRRQGIMSIYQPLAFDERVLSYLPKTERSYPLTFIGGISPVHSERTSFLEQLAEQLPLLFWGYGVELLNNDSLLKQCFQGEAWGLKMFAVLAQSRITLNKHIINVSENYAANMRLFEATGCGALLITDYKDNLNELFLIGKEVVAYRSLDEAVSLVKYYMRYPQEAEVIAKAGQQRTLNNHTYTKRMEQTAEILERELRYQQESQLFPKPDMEKISYGYSQISKTEITPQLTVAWKNESIPAKQRALVQQELQYMKHGRPHMILRVLSEILRPYVYDDILMLEIGCSSGYYYEILSYLLNKRLRYWGVDYSYPLIKMAKDYYPQAQFVVADGAKLPFKTNSFPVVISGGILLHTPNYSEHIEETVRVAEKLIAVHRTSLCRLRETQYQKKYAYGVETVELRFNEEQFLKEFDRRGLNLISSVTYAEDKARDEFETTFLFKKS